MFEVMHDQENHDDLNDNLPDEELCVQMAVRLAAALPNDPEQGKAIMGMVQTMYATLTELRQARGRALTG